MGPRHAFKGERAQERDETYLGNSVRTGTSRVHPAVQVRSAPEQRQ